MVLSKGRKNDDEQVKRSMRTSGGGRCSGGEWSREKKLTGTREETGEKLPAKIEKGKKNNLKPYRFSLPKTARALEE